MDNFSWKSILDTNIGMENNSDYVDSYLCSDYVNIWYFM